MKVIILWVDKGTFTWKETENRLGAITGITESFLEGSLARNNTSDAEIGYRAVG